MAKQKKIRDTPLKGKPVTIILLAFAGIGLISFLLGVFGAHPQRAWQAYLINFLLWSAIAQGGLLFSAVMHVTKARWGHPLTVLSESFAAFFPVSFVLFLLLFLGSGHIFPWLHHDLHGRQGWLNLPLLFSRDFVALCVLYGLGFAYLYYAMWLRKDDAPPKGRLGSLLLERWARRQKDAQWCRDRMSLFAVLYIVAYALVLTLLALDLVMSMEPYWVSTLFGAYYFIKAFYIGLGALIILASIQSIRLGDRSGLSSTQFHDLGKLFFAFCLLWGDFFYCQLIVIWYGNISEETGFIIQRVMVLPWRDLAWTVFALGFLIPFLILLNRGIKTRPVPMIILCSMVLIGIWLENLLLLGPALNRGLTSLPIGFRDGLISLGFLGLMAAALTCFFTIFPQSRVAETTGGNA